MDQQISYKTFFIKYGIFVGIVAVLIGLLIYPVKATQKNWTKNLKNSVEIVLDENEPNGWTVGNPVKIKNPFTMSAACFEIRSKKSGDLSKAIVIRVQTMYGPMPAVFIVDREAKVEFVGFVALHGRIAEQIKYNINNKRIDYWKKKIPELVK